MSSSASPRATAAVSMRRFAPPAEHRSELPLSIPAAPAPSSSGTATRGPFLVLTGVRASQPCYHSFATEAEWRQQLLSLLIDGADPDHIEVPPRLSSLTIEQLLALHWQKREGLQDHAIFTVIEPRPIGSDAPNIWLHPWTEDRSALTGAFTTGACQARK